MTETVLLIRELAGVKVKASDVGPVFRIPAFSQVRRLGTSSAIAGMVEIQWRDDVYAVFPEDLQARSEPSDRPLRHYDVQPR